MSEDYRKRRAQIVRDVGDGVLQKLFVLHGTGYDLTLLIVISVEESGHTLKLFIHQRDIEHLLAVVIDKLLELIGDFLYLRSELDVLIKE